jgi:hypothetical protein
VLGTVGIEKCTKIHLFCSSPESSLTESSKTPETLSSQLHGNIKIDECVSIWEALNRNTEKGRKRRGERR